MVTVMASVGWLGCFDLDKYIAFFLFVMAIRLSERRTRIHAWITGMKTTGMAMETGKMKRGLRLHVIPTVVDGWALHCIFNVDCTVLYLIMSILLACGFHADIKEL
jgi:hypothetical protein